LARQLESDFVSAFERVAPSVVVIDVDRSGDDAAPIGFFLGEPEDGRPPGNGNPDRHTPLPERDPLSRNQGSGVIIREDGYVITNHHVVDRAARITVHLKDGRRLVARHLGSDTRADIALLKLDGEQFPCARLGTSADARIGQWTIAIGAPFSLDYSYSVGWLSGKGRGELISGQYVQYLQTTAPINPGNSGGPLCNIDGDVIGINTLIQGIGTGLGFAVPIDLVRDVANQLIATGKVVRPWLGVRIRSVRESEDLVSRYFPNLDSGVLVEGIESGAPASVSTIKPFDIITAVDGIPVHTASDLQSIIITKRVGQEVRITLSRVNRQRAIQTSEMVITLSEMPAQLQAANGVRDKETVAETPAHDRLGLRVADLSDELRRRFNAPNAALQGVVVLEIDENSPAFASGLRVGTIITDLDQSPIKNSEDYKSAIATADLQRGILMLTSRAGVQSFCVVSSEE
jgi:S1-C subfamily serine protease